MRRGRVFLQPLYVRTLVYFFPRADTSTIFTTCRPLPASGIVDMAGLVHADSAALAVLLELKKRAAAEGHRLSFAAFPPMLESLAHVYGIEDLFA